MFWIKSIFKATCTLDNCYSADTLPSFRCNPHSGAAIILIWRALVLALHAAPAWVAKVSPIQNPLLNCEWRGWLLTINKNPNKLYTIFSHPHLPPVLFSFFRLAVRELTAVKFFAIKYYLQKSAWPEFDPYRRLLLTWLKFLICFFILHL